MPVFNLLLACEKGKTVKKRLKRENSEDATKKLRQGTFRTLGQSFPCPTPPSTHLGSTMWRELEWRMQIDADRCKVGHAKSSTKLVCLK